MRHALQRSRLGSGILGGQPGPLPAWQANRFAGQRRADRPCPLARRVERVLPTEIDA